MNVARAVARAEPVKSCRILFRFLLAEKWGKNVLIIYAPQECPSGSEGQTCRDAGFRSGFCWLKGGKKLH